MKSTICVIVFTFLTFSVAAQGDESKCCCTTYDTSVCLSKIHEKLDADLNKAYAAALKESKDSATDTSNLKNAQQKWIEYRDAACKAEYGLWGWGSGGPNALTMCLIRITRIRVAELKNAYLNCKPHCEQASTARQPEHPRLRESE